MLSLTLIKLGGSVITNKEVPMMVRQEVLNRLAREVAQARQKTGEVYIVGHGQGSFAHAPALRYQTMDGFVHKDSVVGMAITQDSAAQLNRIVVKAFLAEQLPAVSFLFSNGMVTRGGKSQHWCGEVLDQYLEKGLFPVTGGDVIVDSKQGCTIWSTEKVLAHLVDYYLQKKQYSVKRVIHVTEVDGALAADGSVIERVTEGNYAEVGKLINGTKGFDVTGGMGHKLEESLELAKKGVESYILSGLQPQNLYNALLEEKWVGTRVSA